MKGAESGVGGLGRRVWMPVGLALLGIVAFANALDSPFLFDDQEALVESEHITSLLPLSRSLSGPISSPLAGRPLVAFSFAMNYAATGLDSYAFHAVNVLLHLLTGLVLWGVVRRTLRHGTLAPTYAVAADGLALAISALWLIHPLQSEVINYVSQRTEILAGLFYLLSLYAAIRTGATPLAGKWMFIAFVSCLLGMASKEVVVTAPLMVVLYDLSLRESTMASVFRTRWPLYASLFSTWLLLAWIVAGDPRGESAGLSAGMSPWFYLKNQGPLLLEYSRLVFWPATMSADYGYPVALPWQAALPGFLFAGVGIIGSIVLCLRGNPVALLGFWFFIILAPSSSVIPIATEVGADRRLYLPLIAPLSFVVLGGYRLVQSGKTPLRPGVLWLGACLLVAALVVRTVIRNQDYASTFAVWTSAVAARPDNWRAHNNLGRVYAEAGDGTKALRHFEIAVDLKNDYARGVLNLAAALAAQGEESRAIEQYRQLVVLEPDYPPAYFELGRLLARAGEDDAAIENYRMALEWSPEFLAARKRLAFALLRRGENEAAEREFEAVLEIQPQWKRGRRGLARARANSS